MERVADSMPNSEPPAWLVGFASAVIDADNLTDPVKEVLRAVVAGLPAAGGAALATVKGGKPRRLAFYGELADRTERIQMHLGEGPTLQSLTDGYVVGSVDLADDTRWPKLREAGAALPGRSVLCWPLDYSRPRPTTLILYAAEPAGLSGLGVDTTGWVLVNADTALAGLAHHARIQHLQRALKTNDRIGMAIGVLVGLHGYTEQDAYQALVSTSQALNRKLNHLAEEVALTGALPELPLEAHAAR